MDNHEQWDCLNGSEDNCVIERIEVRLKGKKPLIIESPKLSEILTVTRQYLNLTEPQVHRFLAQAVLDTPDPLTIDEHFRLIHALESSLKAQNTAEQTGA